MDSLIQALRLAGHASVADQLLAAVQGGSTSGEILDRIGVVLRDQHALRRTLPKPAIAAWDAVLTQVNQDYPLRRFAAWLRAASRRGES